MVNEAAGPIGSQHLCDLIPLQDMEVPSLLVLVLPMSELLKDKNLPYRHTEFRDPPGVGLRLTPIPAVPSL